MINKIVVITKNKFVLEPKLEEAKTLGIIIKITTVSYTHLTLPTTDRV